MERYTVCRSKHELFHQLFIQRYKEFTSITVKIALILQNKKPKSPTLKGCRNQHDHNLEGSIQGFACLE